MYEGRLKKEGNLKKRMTENVNNPEKENDPKHCAGREGGTLGSDVTLSS